MKQTNKSIRLACAIALGLTAISLIPKPAYAGPHYLWGTIINITTTSGGLMVMLGSGVPDNCAGVGYGWMLIPEANKTMIATALATWATGNKNVTVFTNPLSGGTCVINQFDPEN